MIQNLKYSKVLSLIANNLKTKDINNSYRTALVNLIYATNHNFEEFIYEE